jgi:hypothetical protein
VVLHLAGQPAGRGTRRRRAGRPRRRAQRPRPRLESSSLSRDHPG